MDKITPFLAGTAQIMPCGICLIAAAICAAPSPLLAQTYSVPTPIEVRMADENGVDVASGIAHFSVSDVAIAGMAHSVSTVHSPPNHVSGFPPRITDDSYHGGLGYNRPLPGGGTWDYRWSWVVGIGDINETFFVNSDGTLEATKGGTLVPPSGSAGTFNCGTDTGIWTYTSGQGVVVSIDTGKSYTGIGGSATSGNPGTCGVATKVVYPDGTIVRINARSVYDRLSRIQSVTRNDGFELKYQYAENGTYVSGPIISFYDLQHVVAVNNAYDGCDPAADICSFTYPWPQSTYSWGSGDSVLTVTDQSGGTTRFSMDRFNRVIAVKPPGSSVDTATYEYCARPRYLDTTGNWVDPTSTELSQMCSVNTWGGGGPSPGSITLSYVWDRTRKVTRNGQVWTYNFPTGNYGYYYLHYDSVDPHGLQGVAISTVLGTGALLVVGSPTRVANFENSSRNRITSGQVRGGLAQTYTYDSRGNVTSDGIITAGFDTACANMVTCNKPNWTKDHAGNQTDLTYDPTHGGILTVTSPAVKGIRPQKRYTYVQRYAWFKNSAGTMTRSTEPIWKLSTESYCRTSAASGTGCSVAGDEVVTSYDYGPDSGPNNLLLRGVVVSADGQSLRTCYSYDKYGNKISETTPNAALGTCS